MNFLGSYSVAAGSIFPIVMIPVVVGLVLIAGARVSRKHTETPNPRLQHSASVKIIAIFEHFAGH
jgi:hypothetical protein